MTVTRIVKAFILSARASLGGLLGLAVGMGGLKTGWHPVHVAAREWVRSHMVRYSETGHEVTSRIQRYLVVERRHWNPFLKNVKILLSEEMSEVVLLVSHSL